MTTEVLGRMVFSLVLSGALAWAVYDRSQEEMDLDRQRYLPYISGTLLPVCLVTLVICSFLSFDTQDAMDVILGFCFGVFLHICLYYLLLLPALPFLRRHISARACAVLWMIPNYLYLTQMTYMSLPAPRWVLEVPTALLWVLFFLWLVGFLGLLGWKILSHLSFRHRVLKNASPVTDPKVLKIWRQEVEAARFSKPKFRLVTSPAVQTPLSIGLFKRSVRVVLPRRDYTSGELELIFRHELVHIGREDAWNKFFLVFCTAMCWFDPLLWTAMRRSSEDLELSCDETVLLDAGEETRRQYAGLLLDTVGDERGFTTCLSASANSLRYRLKNVVSPRKTSSGALAVALCFFLLCMSCGYVALCYGEDTGAELIYQSRPLEETTLRSLQLGNEPYDPFLICTDEEALHRHLAALPLKRVAGNYSFKEESPLLVLLLDTPEGVLGVALRDHCVSLNPLYGERGVSNYYLPESETLDALRDCIFTCPALNVRLTDEQGGTSRISASPRRVSLSEGGADTLLYEQEDQKSPTGIYGSLLYRQGEFDFRDPPVGTYQAELTLPDGSTQTFSLKGRSAAIPLPESPFLCTVRGQFQREDGALCKAEFQFEIGTL